MSEAKEKTELSEKLNDIVKAIEKITVLEAATLVKALEERLGVTAAVPMAQMASLAQAAPGAQQAAAEEKSTFTVVLAEVGANKIQVIKEIRTVTTLGLKEAKDLVDSAPKTIKENIPKEEAENIKKKLETVGAKVELK
ncbi:MAG: 50S ribosomal protein L7/L12 [Candidatus Omnitrophota bacterium]